MRAAGLRVALLHWTAPPTTGGVESHLVDLARFLAAEGARVTLVVGEARPDAIDGGAAIEIATLGELDLDAIRQRPELRGEAATGRLEAALGALLESRAVDVVHGHNLHHFSPAPALALDRLRRRLGFRLFHTFHETWPDLLADNPVYAGWEGNFAVSAHVQRECAARLGFRPRLHRLGIDPARFAAAPPSPGDGPVRLLHPARVLPWKGVHVSVEMLALLRGRGLDAVLTVTDTQRIADWNQELSAYRELVVGLARRLGVLDRLRFRPARFEEMPSLYADADIVIYPTIGEEPYGLVPLEAMGCRRPVVASRSGGIPETVRHGETGFLVAPGDAAGLADRVAALIADPGLRRRMGEAGRSRVERLFDGRRYAERLVGCYRGEPLPPSELDQP